MSIFAKLRNPVVAYGFIVVMGSVGVGLYQVIIKPVMATVTAPAEGQPAEQPKHKLSAVDQLLDNAGVKNPFASLVQGDKFKSRLKKEASQPEAAPATAQPAEPAKTWQEKTREALTGAVKPAAAPAAAEAQPPAPPEAAQPAPAQPAKAAAPAKVVKADKPKHKPAGSQQDSGGSTDWDGINKSLDNALQH